MSNDPSTRAIITTVAGAVIGYFVPGVGLAGGMAIGSIFGAVWNKIESLFHNQKRTNTFHGRPGLIQNITLS